jgi:hypothetical protein
MSWSYRITALYLGFVGIIVTLVVIANRENIELESKDYYQQELKYQDKLDAIKNANGLSKTIEHTVSDDRIILFIPFDLISKDLTGEIYFYCPANSENDLKVKMNFDDKGQQVINRSKLKPGAYKMRLSWTSSGKNYFKEEVISIK